MCDIPPKLASTRHCILHRQRVERSSKVLLDLMPGSSVVWLGQRMAPRRYFPHRLVPGWCHCSGIIQCRSQGMHKFNGQWEKRVRRRHNLPTPEDEARQTNGSAQPTGAKNRWSPSKAVFHKAEPSQRRSVTALRRQGCTERANVQLVRQQRSGVGECSTHEPAIWQVCAILLPSRGYDAGPRRLCT